MSVTLLDSYHIFGTKEQLKAFGFFESVPLRFSGNTLCSTLLSPSPLQEVMTEGEGIGGGEGGEASPPQLEEERLLSVLTHGSTGRNPTFFKAAGHGDVFGLKADIPAGGQTLDGAPEGQAGRAEGEQNVLYVQLPEGHPVITKSSEEEVVEAEAVDTTVEAAMATTTTATTELSLEEAIAQAEVVFDDGGMTEETGCDAASAVCQGGDTQNA